jgi:hypothetical protein
MKRYRASLKMYFGQRFHTPMKLQKNAFNSYTPKFNIVEFFVVNFICEQNKYTVNQKHKHFDYVCTRELFVGVNWLN